MSKMAVTYVATFVAVLVCLTLIPPTEGYCSEPLPINTASSLLFALLTVLTIRLLNISITPFNAMGVALFLSFFSTSAAQFFMRNEESLAQLASQCIVPFFITQYMRVSRKNFGRWYLLMLLMGIFCSYTHNGITIPLCATFIWLSFRRKHFWRAACWPMVVGFCIGTGMSIWRVRHGDAVNAGMAESTTLALQLLWNTKIIVFGLGLTAYLLMQKKGRRTLRYIARRNAVLSTCLAMSLVTLPLALLGVDNAIEGVCFFTMLLSLATCQFILKTTLKKIQ
ncbi:MAG: hypothetical protein UHL07_00405 [Bacteroidaceae bacterium]|nr:hypothetical protein [Bacteroidaceae bacterium]